MKPDPPLRRDRTCAVCLGPRKIPKGVWARAEAAADPFCSATCARIWHDCPLPAIDRPLKATVKKWGTDARRRYRQEHRQKELERERAWRKRQKEQVA